MCTGAGAGADLAGNIAEGFRCSLLGPIANMFLSWDRSREAIAIAADRALELCGSLWGVVILRAVGTLRRGEENQVHELVDGQVRLFEFSVKPDEMLRELRNQARSIVDVEDEPAAVPAMETAGPSRSDEVVDLISDDSGDEGGYRPAIEHLGERQTDETVFAKCGVENRVGLDDGANARSKAPRSRENAFGVDTPRVPRGKFTPNLPKYGSAARAERAKKQHVDSAAMMLDAGKTGDGKEEKEELVGGGQGGAGSAESAAPVDPEEEETPVGVPLVGVAEVEARLVAVHDRYKTDSQTLRELLAAVPPRDGAQQDARSLVRPQPCAVLREGRLQHDTWPRGAAGMQTSSEVEDAESAVCEAVVLNSALVAMLTALPESPGPCSDAVGLVFCRAPSLQDRTGAPLAVIHARMVCCLAATEGGEGKATRKSKQGKRAQSSRLDEGAFRNAMHAANDSQLRVVGWFRTSGGGGESDPANEGAEALDAELCDLLTKHGVPGNSDGALSFFCTVSGLENKACAPRPEAMPLRDIAVRFTAMRWMQESHRSRPLRWRVAELPSMPMHDIECIARSAHDILVPSKPGKGSAISDCVLSVPLRFHREDGPPAPATPGDPARRRSLLQAVRTLLQLEQLARDLSAAVAHAHLRIALCRGKRSPAGVASTLVKGAAGKGDDPGRDGTVEAICNGEGGRSPRAESQGAASVLFLTGGGASGTLTSPGRFTLPRVRPAQHHARCLRCCSLGVGAEKQSPVAECTVRSGSLSPRRERMRLQRKAKRILPRSAGWRMRQARQLKK